MQTALERKYGGHRKMKNLIKQHAFWSLLALIGMIMAVVTGHQIMSGMKPRDNSATERE